MPEGTARTKTGLSVDRLVLTSCYVGYTLLDGNNSMMSSCELCVDNNRVSIFWDPPLANCSGETDDHDCTSSRCKCNCRWDELPLLEAHVLILIQIIQRLLQLSSLLNRNEQEMKVFFTEAHGVSDCIVFSFYHTTYCTNTWAYTSKTALCPISIMQYNELLNFCLISGTVLYQLISDYIEILDIHSIWLLIPNETYYV